MPSIRIATRPSRPQPALSLTVKLLYAAQGQDAPLAAEGLRQARLWLTQPGSGADGRRRWERLRKARRNLRLYPYLGAPSDEQPGYYQLVVSGHRVIYRIDPDTGDTNTAGDIRILIVLGPGQA